MLLRLMRNRAKNSYVRIDRFLGRENGEHNIYHYEQTVEFDLIISCLGVFCLLVVVGQAPDWHVRATNLFRNFIHIHIIHKAIIF